MVKPEEIIKEFEWRSAELERDGRYPAWTAQEIAELIREMIKGEDRTDDS